MFEIGEYVNGENEYTQEQMLGMPTVQYVGNPTCTRGENGESVESGRIDPDGYIWVWDSGYGWMCWGAFARENWRILPAASTLGSITSPRKSATSRENGKKGGRPRKYQLPEMYQYDMIARLHREDYTPAEYRARYRDYCKHYGFKHRVEGGWIFFEFSTDYDIWLNQK